MLNNRLLPRTAGNCLALLAASLIAFQLLIGGFLMNSTPNSIGLIKCRVLLPLNGVPEAAASSFSARPPSTTLGKEDGTDSFPQDEDRVLCFCFFEHLPMRRIRNLLLINSSFEIKKIKTRNSTFFLPSSRAITEAKIKTLEKFQA